eukprot:Colp12_sorted_trinity150504_noHs@12233
MSKRLVNFAAGPAKIPEEVLVNWKGCGMSVMEMSHRGKHFQSIIDQAEADLREVFAIPSNYKVLFLQGGATTQFAAIPLNLLRKQGASADYIVTGNWSLRAAEEAEKYGTVNYVLPKTKKYTDIPPRSEWNLNPDAAYVYYCANETVYGVEFPDIPETNGVPLIGDFSSTFLSRPIDVSRFAVIYGGAQKNLGPAGLTIVIIREDFIGHELPITPIMLSYKVAADNQSMYNTPPTYAIYMAGLVFQWMKRQGGLEAIAGRNKAKADLLYSAIESSEGFYRAPVAAGARSWMNVPFRVRDDAALEAKFIKEAEARGLVELKGHRSVGGVRASIYNAMTVEEVQLLVDFMRDFQAANSH